MLLFGPQAGRKDGVASRPFCGFSRVPFCVSGLHISLVVRILRVASAENRKENREENRLQHGFPVTFEFCSNEE